MRIALVLAMLVVAQVHQLPGRHGVTTLVSARSRRDPVQPASAMPDGWSWAEFIGDSAILLAFVGMLVLSILTKSLPGMWTHAPAAGRRKVARSRRRPA